MSQPLITQEVGGATRVPGKGPMLLRGNVEHPASGTARTIARFLKNS
ncbi:MAG: hypothetical protein O2983_15830 [Planctomycetota bacterium]|nr:hypothetical protein [Planctomycetota bacterium]MDA0920689.1 hypothetical protein [Planctomycetota bacterium]MDA1161074.1 hypothetical protein [Planctomycetota bacterium]